MIDRLKTLFLRNTSPRQTIAKNFAWLSAGEFASRLLRSLIILYAARVLGAEGYGVFSYALGLAGFFTIFSAMGLDNILTRNTAQYPNMRRRYFSTIFLLKSFLMLLTALLVMFVAPFLSQIDSARSILPFAAILVIFDGVRNTVSSFFRGLERMEGEALLSVVTNVGITIIGFIALIFRPTPAALALSYVGGAALGALLGIFLIRQYLFPLFKHFDRRLLAPTFIAAWPLALSVVLSIFLTHIDILMLGFWYDAAVVGIYSAPLRIIQILQILPTLFSVSIFPHLSRLLSSGRNQKTLVSITEHSLTFLFALSVPLSIGGVILARPLMNVLFGMEYVSGSLILQILLLGPLLIFPGIFLPNLIFAYNRHRNLSWYTGAAALTNVVCNLFLIPAFGGVGSAIATELSQLVFLILTWRLALRCLRFSILPHLRGILVSAFLMGGLTLILSFFTNLHVFLVVLISALFYLLLLFLFRETFLFQMFNLFRRTLIKQTSSTTP